VAYSESEPGIVGSDSKDVIDARDDWTMAVRNSVLPIDAVTYFSEATSDNVSELRLIGVTVSDSVVNLVKSVKSDEGQTSYPVSHDDIGTATPLLLEISGCKV
jgi:hypothetical protein